MAKKSFKTSIEKTGLKSRGGLSSLVRNTSSEEKKVETSPETAIQGENLKKTLQTEKEETTLVTPITQKQKKPPKDLRQTFIVGSDYLEKIKDYVHLVRVSGNLYFSQKDVLHEALDLLFAQVGTIPPRPQIVRLKEEERKQKIKAGRRK